MAHQRHCLVLLYPYPDTVRSCQLHETLGSSLLIKCSLPYASPGKTFSPAVADCRFRAPQTPRLAQYNHYNCSLPILQAILPFCPGAKSGQNPFKIRAESGQNSGKIRLMNGAGAGGFGIGPPWFQSVFFGAELLLRLGEIIDKRVCFHYTLVNGVALLRVMQI